MLFVMKLTSVNTRIQLVCKISVHLQFININGVFFLLFQIFPSSVSYDYKTMAATSDSFYYNYDDIR